jgi:hypothetical protein
VKCPSFCKEDVDMNGKMSVMGVAPLVAVPSFLHLGAAIALHSALFPLFAFTPAPGLAMPVAGVVLIAFGLFMLLSSGLSVLKAFREQRLLTDSAVMYALFRALVPAEDRWLKEQFGAK